MNNRQRFMAVMNYQSYDKLPVIHFGYWNELLAKWAAEGHITEYDAKNWSDGNEVCQKLNKMLGFDFGFQQFYDINNHLMPNFTTEVVQTLPDGSSHVRNSDGVTELHIPGALSIHAELEHLLVDRASYEKHYKWRLDSSKNRLSANAAAEIAKWNQVTEYPNKFQVGSVIGAVRGLLGVMGLSYMQVDDPELLGEILDDYNNVAYCNTKALLEAGFRPDSAHYWEDICFNHGPLVSPDFFRQYLMKHYLRMNELLRSYNCQLISIDCDGMIDELLPLWLESGVNIMFPIEIGTWNPDFAAWRKKYGKNLRGVGAMNKHVLSKDKAAVDAEIERIKPLVELGGFIPCPDHRLPPETSWELVRYYTDKMHEVF